MPNAVTIGEVMLRCGVDAADFEKFAAEEYNPFGQLPGAEYYILKGVRGDRTGGYLHLVRSEVVTSASAQNRRGEEPLSRHLPEQATGEPADEFQQWIRFGLGQATAAKWDSWAQTGLYTAYRTVGKEMAEEVLIEPVMLRPGVRGADFERFVIEQYYAMSRLCGEEGYLLKGDQGDRMGKYMLLIAYESVEVRNRRSTSGGVIESSFREEAELDLFAEQIVWSGLVAWFEECFKLGVEQGFSPELMVLELYASGEASEIMELMARNGFYRQMAHHSTTSQYGTLTRSADLLNDDIRAKMRNSVVNDIKGGAFIKEWSQEQAEGSTVLEQLRQAALSNAMSQAEEEVISLVQQASRLD